MLASRMLISTLKEAPNDAKIQSHILLIRGGFIKNEVAGVYNYLPLGVRVLNKIEKVIREEMDKSGAVEILCSAIQPKELWEESGRWSKYGDELFRFKDRHQREFCLGPTHEEVFTSIVRDVVKSKSSLPLNLYQIQTKYRDEARPRFGLMRSREFIMKDAYSFDVDQEGLEKSYQLMFDTYTNIFTRFGLHFKPVLADTGAIGGNGSHQFMALSDIGESDIVYCDDCGYAADVEKAETLNIKNEENVELKDKELFNVGDAKSIEDMEKVYNRPRTEMIKSVLYKNREDGKLFLCLVRGDREVNEIKLVNHIGIPEAFLTFGNDDDIKKINSVLGYIGPVGQNIDVLVDYEVANMKNAICGANIDKMNYINVNYGKDFKGEVIDLRKAVEGDLCPCCKKPLKMRRGIEVGQIFKLQTKYSSAMNLTYTNEDGKNIPMVMGCYGIGVTRTMCAIVEQNNDEFGIKWPLNVAPYHVVIIPISAKDEEQMNLAKELHAELEKARVEVVLDDRDQKPGYKFKDWDLMGLPFEIICGRRSNENIVEFKNRLTNEKVELTKEEALKFVIDEVSKVR